MKSAILWMITRGCWTGFQAIDTHLPDGVLFKMSMGAPKFSRFRRKASKWLGQCSGAEADFTDSTLYGGKTREG